jgi:hypothetical protein
LVILSKTPLFSLLKKKMLFSDVLKLKTRY